MYFNNKLMLRLGTWETSLTLYKQKLLVFLNTIKNKQLTKYKVTVIQFYGSRKLK